ncbi:MAG: hypothetical protein BroJett021_39500 [Chloroflexota bacterium]|jgi:hypothetical protein|nr:hypothetical protein [Caldilinea sp.]GIK74962.1 MAG: hypothetical protein BroJett021_39500 [Chloroflexota bacterium]
MTTDTQILIAFILYLVFFGWIGYRRGFVSEVWFFAITIVSWVLLQERGSIVVRLTNFAGKFVVLVRSGGLTGEGEDAFQALAEAPNVITDENQAGFLFLVWALVVLITFLVTSDPRIMKRSKSKAWGVAFGVLNGIVLAAILLPYLSRALQTAPEIQAQNAALGGLFALVSRLWELSAATLQTVWSWVVTMPPTGWLVFITLLLLLIAWPMRSGVVGKK